MGSYEIIVKTEEIRRRVQEGDYTAAQKIMDTIPLKKVKNIADLSLFAEIYTQNERYDEAMELLYRVYKKSRTRRTLYQMVSVSIERKNIKEAERFYEEYISIAPNDYNNYIFRYKIDKLKKAPYDVLIASLKNLKKQTYMEKWAYELAKLYYKAGMEKECIQECSDIILWFGEGSYVEKAKILKAYYLGEVDKEDIIEKLKSRNSKEKEISEDNNGSKEENSRNNQEMISDDTLQRQNVIQEDNLYQEAAILEENNAEFAEDQNQSKLNQNISPDGDNLISDRQEIMPDENNQNDNIRNDENQREEAQNNTDLAQDTGESNDSNDKDNKKGKSKRRIVLSGHEDETSIINELTDYFSKEVDKYLANKQDTEEKNEPTEKDVAEEFDRILNPHGINEDREKINRLSEELNVDLNQIFGNFMHIKTLQKQLSNSLELIMSKHTKSVQLIITGEPSSGKTTLAKDIAIFLKKTGKLQTSRIAKISAQKLNKIDLMSRKEELKNCCLVIENASELKRPTIDKLLKLIDYFHGDIAVIFEENKKNMNRLFRECPRLMEIFNNRIHIPPYSEDDLLGFAYANIVQKGYKLHPSALYVLKIGVYEIIYNEEKEKRLEKISEYVRNAMTSADIRTGRQLSTIVAEKRLADIEFLSLLPEDFTRQIRA